LVAQRLKQPTRKQARAAPHVPLFGLATNGVYPASARYPTERCALTAPFHPDQHASKLAVYFLWHFPGIPPTRRYLASCPMQPGLSSVTVAVNAITQATSLAQHKKATGNSKGKQQLLGRYPTLVNSTA